MPIRVLVVDDSTFIRKALIDILRKDKDIQVIGEARDGEEAIQKFQELKPDVVTLDYEMPRKNGLETLQEIMRIRPTPVVMISSYTKEGALITLRCLESGAVDFVPKDIEKGTLEVFRKATEIVDKIKNAARSKVKIPIRTVEDRTTQVIERTHQVAERKRSQMLSMDLTSIKKVVVIGASTGGPSTILDIFSVMSPLPAAFVVVIHMPPVFTQTYAQRLSERTGFQAEEAKDGDRLEPGKIYVAPGGRHIRFAKDGTIRVVDEPRNSIYKPSIDLAMESAAEVFGNKLIAIILTGMGSDGVEGIKKVKASGGVVISENEKSAVIFGMPRAAIESGCVDYIEDAHRIPHIIENLVK